MKAIRLLQTTCCLAALALGTAAASQSIVVNYNALDSLPPRATDHAAVPPVLTPPGMIHRAAVVPNPPYAGNAPDGTANAVPPIFERRSILYNRYDNESDRSGTMTAFGNPALFRDVRGAGITGASNVPAVPGIAQQETAMLTPTSYSAPSYFGDARSPGYLNPHAAADDPFNEALWRRAKRVGEVVFRNDGYDVLDIDQTTLAELDRLATEIGNQPQRIMLLAFGGMRGDDSHEAHRMALKRGLAVRRYLIARGVSSTLIDVTAVGGATDGGPLDRVDVVASSG